VAKERSSRSFLALLAGLRFESPRDANLFLALLPLVVAALGVVALVAAGLAVEASKALSRFGLSLLTSSVWRPASSPELEAYGLAPALLGSFFVSLVALAVAAPLSIALAVTLAELAPIGVGRVLESLVVLMGSVPTVVYGLWGSLVLAPFIKERVALPLHERLGFLYPLFSCAPITGHSALTAGLVLAFATLPYTTALLVEGYRAVPRKYKEAAYSIGALDYQMHLLVLGMMKPYIVAALLLGLSRALGETTIVAMTVGNAMRFSGCLLDATATVPSLIVNQLESAGLYAYALPALYAGALVLLLACVALSGVGVVVMYKWRRAVALG